MSATCSPRTRRARPLPRPTPHQSEVSSSRCRAHCCSGALLCTCGPEPHVHLRAGSFQRALNLSGTYACRQPWAECSRAKCLTDTALSVTGLAACISIWGKCHAPALPVPLPCGCTDQYTHYFKCPVPDLPLAAPLHGHCFGALGAWHVKASALCFQLPTCWDVMLLPPNYDYAPRNGPQP